MSFAVKGNTAFLIGWFVGFEGDLGKSSGRCSDWSRSWEVIVMRAQADVANGSVGGSERDHVVLW